MIEMRMKKRGISVRSLWYPQNAQAVVDQEDLSTHTAASIDEPTAASIDGALAKYRKKLTLDS